tara:strand:+ start:311 stop:652 length:342 start_codon:yes stop_codon:yes gene_type:complete
MATYKILVPKPASANELGTDTRLYKHDEIVNANEGWLENIMQSFVENGWAIEVKADDLSDTETTEPVRARNEKGHYIADDPSTPDVNEAYEGGKTPKKTTKKTTKKSTKKKTS